MFRDIQIVIITNFAVVSNVGIKRVDCIRNEFYICGFDQCVNDGDSLTD